MSSPIIIISHPPTGNAVETEGTLQLTSVNLPTITGATQLQFPESMTIEEVTAHLQQVVSYLTA